MKSTLKAKMAIATFALGLAVQAHAQTTAHITVNLWCNRTTGLGHDSLYEKAAFLGNWSNGKKIVEFSWDFGGWAINDSEGFDSQGSTPDIQTVTLYPNTDEWVDYSLDAKSSWPIGDILTGLGFVADTFFPELTGGYAGAATSIANRMARGSGTVATLRAHVVCSANGTIWVQEVVPYGNAYDRGTDPNGFVSFGFHANRAEYFVGIRAR